MTAAGVASATRTGQLEQLRALHCRVNREEQPTASENTWHECNGPLKQCALGREHGWWGSLRSHLEVWRTQGQGRGAQAMAPSRVPTSPWCNGACAGA